MLSSHLASILGHHCLLIYLQHVLLHRPAEIAAESHHIPFPTNECNHHLYKLNVNFYFQFNSYSTVFNIEYITILLLFFTTTVIKSTLIVSIRYPRYYYYCCTEEKLLNRCYRAQRIIHNHEFYTNSTRCTIPPPWT